MTTVMRSTNPAYTRAMSSSAKDVAIVGAGPAGLMAAEVLALGGADVTVYDAMPSAGRKFLMAGRGGLNLTHSEPLPQFLARYREAMPLLKGAIEAFPPQALRDWSETLGQETFIGTSGRVFPKAFKASPLLRAWLRRLDSMGVRLALRHRWTGWDEQGRLCFQTRDGLHAVDSKATVLALGGASWPRLGSDGAWTKILAAKGVKISPLRPANSGFTVAWSDIFRDRFEGQPLKGVALKFGEHEVRGEAVVTRSGIEGGAVYALSADLREAVESSGRATLHVGLRPDLEMNDLVARVSAPKGKQSLSNFLRKAIHLSPVAIGLLQETARASGVSLSSLSVADLASLINAVPIRAHRHSANRAGDLDGRRDTVRRTRCRLYAPSLARRVRGRRDAGLGSADRRLSAASVVRDGRGGGQGCAHGRWLD